MKRSFTILVLLVLFLTSSTVAFGQKTRSTIGLGKSVRSQEAVEISTPEAFTDGNGVYLRWRTIRETDNLGFYVYRIDASIKSSGENQFVAGAGLNSRGQTLYNTDYSFFDPDGTSQSRYYVMSFERNGHRTVSETVFPQFSADLASVAGTGSAELVRTRLQKTGYVAADSLVYSKDVQREVDRNVQIADPVTQRWIASQPAAKIGVRQPGIYRVTRQQLQTAGFDVNTDPSMWQLYTDGVEQAIIVEPSGSYVDFYGKGLDTLESDTRMYYLVAGTQPGRRMVVSGFRPSTSTVKAVNYDATVEARERTSYLLDLLNGDADNYVGHLISTLDSSFNVNLTGVDTTALTAHIDAKFLGYSPTGHAVNFSLNGQLVGQATGLGADQVMSLSVDVPVSLLAEGTNSFSMVTVSGTDFVFFDSVRVTYKRLHRANQNRVSFTTQNYRGAKLGNFSSANIRVFDITNDGSPAQLTGAVITPDGGTFDADIPAYRARAMYAVEDSGLLTPFSIGLNAPSALSTTDHNANMVIIYYKTFTSIAGSWADYRRGQGLQVETVNVEDIFDEFNYGVLSANSLRDFLNYARLNWQTAPQYVLLIGDGTYDPRNYEGFGYNDLVPAKLVDTLYTETASDDAIADFNNDGLAEMAVGRIPVRGTTAATNAMNKTIAFEQTVGTQNLSRGVLFAYDNPIGYDFQMMSQHMQAQLPQGTTSVLVARNDANPNPTLIAEQNNGRYLVNYNGHGTTGAWANANNFSTDHVFMLTNINNLSVYTMLTCLNGYFVGTRSSMAETLLNSQAGGAVAAWASTGETTPDIQETMGVRFYSQIGAGQITRLGDLIRDAKTVITGGRDVRESWVLIGDPMLKMR